MTKAGISLKKIKIATTAKTDVLNYFAVPTALDRGLRWKTFGLGNRDFPAVSRQKPKNHISPT